jgi:tetraacyldisaccharide 4'-kinase
MRAPDFWAEPPGVAASLLAPASAIWRATTKVRSAVARPDRVPVPVICVGNLVAGGAGKTPVVLSLAVLAATRGIAPHVVTRGYGGCLAGPVRVDPVGDNAAMVGDEALLIAATAPCWVAHDRAAGARAAAASGAGVVLLDDGYQNRTIAKDLSLLVVDIEYAFGNGRLIPAGPLREPIAAGIARADAIVLLGDGDPPEAVSGATCPLLRARLRPLDGGRFAGTRVVAFAGIGRPQKFFGSLRAVGADLVITRPFADHHRYRRGEVERLRNKAGAVGARLVTTAKDWVRLPAPWRDGIEVLDVEVYWDDPAALVRLLASPLPETARGYDQRAARG